MPWEQIKKTSFYHINWHKTYRKHWILLKVLKEEGKERTAALIVGHKKEEPNLKSWKIIGNCGKQKQVGYWLMACVFTEGVKI